LDEPEKAEIQVVAEGYWPKNEVVEDFEAPVEQVNVKLQPMFGGVLLGRKFVLDPEFGGWEPGQVSETGLRAADVNLRAAFLAEKLLEAAGAEVELTRREDATMSDQDRVRFGLERDFDWFITIRHAEPRPGHEEPEDMNISRAYAKWGDGRRLAQVFPAQMQEVMDTPGSDLANSSTWEVMHGSDKFQIIGLSPLFMTAPGAAQRLEKQAVLRKEAQAMLYGLVEYYTFADDNGDLPEVADGEPSLDERIRNRTGEVKAVVIEEETGEPLPDVLVGVEEILWTATEEDGRFSWKYLDPGSYSIRFQKTGYAPKVVTVELSGGDVEELEVKLSR
jgi:N-acetylmuramoyl-L-alanine amidase